MRHAKAIQLSSEELAILKSIISSKRSQVRDVFRARIVVLAVQGKTNVAIASALKTHVHTVSLWRNRFDRQRLAGLKDKPGRGRRRTYQATKVKEIIKATLHTKPPNATHWSTRTLADSMGVSHMTIQRIWNAHKIKPHLVRTFKLSTDPHFIEKLHDVVGLYLNPPEHALVLSIDEKSQIQALDRTQPGLPLKQGRCGTMTHDYKRHGTTTLFAALDVLDGSVIGTCMPKHRHQEYLKFLRLINRQTTSDLDIHMIVDNYSTHKHQNVKQWLIKHPRFHVHFIPTSSSWVNMVECFFSQLTKKRIRRGVFHSVQELITAINEYLDNHNHNPKPFIWTKTAYDIIKKIKPLYHLLNYDS
jgi:transposase